MSKRKDLENIINNLETLSTNVSEGQQNTVKNIEKPEITIQYDW